MTHSTVARWALIALTVLPALAFLACGGSSGGSDTSYVAAVCSAEKKFSDSLQAITSDPKLLTDPKAATDPTFLSSKLAPAFDQFAKDFANAKPPSDVKDWHNATAKQFADMAASVKSGKDISQLFSGDGANIPAPPGAASDRLGKIAATNKDCVATGAFQ